MTDNLYETISAADFGAGLRGIGLNILVSDVAKTAEFLTQCFGMQAHRKSRDFAIMTYHNQIFQLHGDHTYHSNPILSLLPETPPRGAGIELRLYDSDPVAACIAATALGLTILQHPTPKPHGLIEAYIADYDGYIWVPSQPLKS